MLCKEESKNFKEKLSSWQRKFQIQIQFFKNVKRARLIMLKDMKE